MSPKRRFLTALLGGKPDRVPVGNVVSVVTTGLMKSSGAWFPGAHLNPELMAQLAATGHTILGYDTVMPVFSVTQEAAALGCRVNLGTSTMMPYVETHPFADSASFKIPAKWTEAPSIQVVLGALQQLRAEFGDRVAIVGKVMGPWSLSYHMLGMEEFLISTKTEPERVRRSVATLKEVTIGFAQAQLRAGADVICVADHITGGIVSPLVYRDLMLSVHQEITSRIGGPSVLHCCGNTSDRIKFFAQAGFDCYHFESQVKLQTAVTEAAGRMTLMGNINNPDVLLAGKPEEVEAACRRALQAGVQILAPECAVPLTTPLQNLRVLVEVAEQG